MMRKSPCEFLCSSLRTFLRQAKESFESIQCAPPQKQPPLAVRVAVDTRRRFNDRYCNVNNANTVKIRRMLWHKYREKHRDMRRQTWHKHGSFLSCNRETRDKMHELYQADYENLLTSIYRYPVHQFASAQSAFKRSINNPLALRVCGVRAMSTSSQDYQQPRSMRQASQMQATVQAHAQARKRGMPCTTKFITHRPSTRILFPRVSPVSPQVRSASSASSFASDYHLSSAHSSIFPCPSETAPSSSTSLVSSSSQAGTAFSTESPPLTGSYVDFPLNPRINVPPVTELTEEVVDQLTNDLEKFADELKRVSSDIRRLASLGQLPASLDNGGLRVHFANCEPDRLRTLMDGVEVSQGIVGTHDDGCSLATTSDALSVMSWSSSSDTSSSSVSSEQFRYIHESSPASSKFDITNLRAMGLPSEKSASSISMPSLTDSPSEGTVSEVSSFC